LNFHLNPARKHQFESQEQLGEGGGYVDLPSEALALMVVVVLCLGGKDDVGCEEAQRTSGKLWCLKARVRIGAHLSVNFAALSVQRQFDRPGRS
jgi:hypothetical protein